MKYFIPVFIYLLMYALVSPAQDRAKRNELWSAYNGLKEDTARVEMLLEELGYFYEDINPDSALALYQKAIDICDENLKRQSPGMILWGKYLSYKAIALRYMGIVNRYLGNYDKSLDFYNQGVAIYLGLIPECGKYKGCLEYNQSLAGCYNNMGVVYKSQGAYNKASEYFLKSLNVFEKMMTSPDSLTSINGGYGSGGCSNNIGLMYTQQGLYEKAEFFLSQSLKIRDSLNDRYGVGQCFNNIGEIHYSKGVFAEDSVTRKKEFSTAMGYFEKAMDIYGHLADSTDNPRAKYYARRGMTDCMGNIGVLYKESGRYSAAIEMYEKSLIIRGEIGDKQGTASEYCNLGLLYLALADKNPTDTTTYFMAKGCAEKAYQFADEIGATEEQKSALRILAIINAGLGRHKKAEQYLGQLIEQDYKDILLNFSFITEKEKEDYFKTITIDFTEFYSFALKRVKENPAIAGEVYNNAVRTKGLLLKSSTAMRQAIINSGNKDLVDLYQNWNEVKKEISKLHNSGKTDRAANLNLLENKADSMEQLLVKNSQVFSDFEKLQAVTWEAVMKNLKPGEAAVEYVRFNYKGSRLSKYSDTILYCAMVIKPGMAFPQMIPLFTEDELIHSLERQKTGDADNINRIYRQKPYNLKGLYEMVWKPLETFLGDVRKVYYSPDGLLHRISFQAIGINKDILLSDRYELQLHSSTSTVAMNETSNPFSFENKVSTLLGGIDYNSGMEKQSSGWTYLEGTLSETQAVSRLLKSGKANLHMLTGATATEDTLKKMACQSHVLHLATHGFFYPDPAERLRTENESEVVTEKTIKFRGSNTGFGAWTFVTNTNPLMRSGLVLAGANKVWSAEDKGGGEDGVLTAQEVTALDMHNTQLLVLSACETGLGDIKGSEGVYGLQRAFKMAGVKYIIMSLWQVPDKETVEFMELFYKKLLKSKEVRKSFNQTQKEMRKNYDPYYWAAFVLIE